MLGIDGGDGAYTLTNEHESVAAVTFAGDSNGSGQAYKHTALWRQEKR